MSAIVSKCGVHSQGSSRNGYGPFLQRIADAGRQLALCKCRDDFGAMDEPLQHWPYVVTIGAKTEWDDAGYGVDFAYNTIVAAHERDPKVKYWEWFNERNGDYARQADLYIALLPRLASLGIGLCMFNCASGTPQYPWIDDAPYREIARACSFANLHGYDALLGLHEYNSEETIGRFKVLADYLAPRGALLPIVITEYGYETYPGKATYLQFVQQADPVYMADARVIGCALWTLGGGAWAGSNYADMLPELGEYIATVEPIAPVDEWEFDYWDIDGERITANPVDLIMNGPHTVTPHARRKDQTQVLTVNPCPEWAGLTVNVTPAGYIYPTGTVVTLQAA